MAAKLGQEILTVLDEVENPGHFVASGTLEDAPIVGLSVHDVGVIGLPLSEHQAKEMISQCAPAPFGRREATLLDKKVRDTWQLEPHQFEILIPEWDTAVGQLVQTIGPQLGFNNNGQHFSPHKDSEKSTGMFASLIITLPSQFDGGELIKSLLHTQWVSFYCDVEHEVRPVTEGYRLALTYNVIYTGRGLPPRITNDAHLIQRLRSCFDRLVGDSEIVGTKLAYVLDHEYTESGLGFSGLKNKDAAIVSLLKRAANPSNFAVYLATLECKDTGTGVGWESPYEFESSERSLSLSNFVDADRDHLDWTDVEIDESEVLQDDVFARLDPDNEETESTGNAGVEMTRWYSTTAVVFWSKRDDIELMVQGQGLKGALKTLKTWVDEGSGAKPRIVNLRGKRTIHNEVIDLTGEDNTTSLPGASTTPTTCDSPDCVELAQIIIRDLGRERRDVGRGYYFSSSSETIPLVHLVDVLCTMRNSALFTQLTQTVPLKLQLEKADIVPELMKALRIFGLPDVQVWVDSLLRTESAQVLFWVTLVKALHQLASEDSEKTEGVSAWCISILTKVVSGSVLPTKSRAFSSDFWSPDVEDIANLLDLSYQFPHHAQSLATSLLAKMQQWPTRGFQQALDAFERRMREWLSGGGREVSDAPFSEFYKWYIPHVLSRVAVGIAQNSSSLFKKNDRTVWHFAGANQQRRSHVRSHFERLGVDVDWTTEKKGNRYTLVATKTTKKWEAKLQQWQNSRESLQGLAVFVGEEVFVQEAGREPSEMYDGVVGSGVAQLVQGNNAAGVKRAANGSALSERKDGSSSSPTVPGSACPLDVKRQKL
ncbi:hypothetical protein HDV00_001267 [Rhizophlyctis rosea]|nr:hypothetical protein HDV00_001267 [Rhizophlyctis rosea]